MLKKYCNFLISEINQEINKSNEIKDELINFYIKLSKSNYLLDCRDINVSDHAYNIIRIYPPIIFVELKKRFKMKAKIEKISILIKMNIFSPELVWEDLD